MEKKEIMIVGLEHSSWFITRLQFSPFLTFFLRYLFAPSPPIFLLFLVAVFSLWVYPALSLAFDAASVHLRRICWCMWLLVVFFFFPCMPLVFQAEICTELNGTLQPCKHLSWGLQSAAKFLIPEEVAVASLALVEWVEWFEKMLGFLVCGAEIMYITLTTTLGFWVIVAAATSSSITAGRVGLSCSTVSNFVGIASSIIVFFHWSMSFEIGQFYDCLLWIDSLPFGHLKSSTTESNDLFMAMSAMFTKVPFLNCNTYL
jgi:hypothetical protein